MQSIVQQCSVVSVQKHRDHGTLLYNRLYNKLAGPITVVFTVWTHVGPRNCALGGGLDLPGEGAVLGTFFWPIVLEVTFLYF